MQATSESGMAVSHPSQCGALASKRGGSLGTRLIKLISMAVSLAGAEGSANMAGSGQWEKVWTALTVCG